MLVHPLTISKGREDMHGNPSTSSKGREGKFSSASSDLLEIHIVSTNKVLQYGSKPLTEDTIVPAPPCTSKQSGSVCQAACPQDRLRPVRSRQTVVRMVKHAVTRRPACWPFSNGRKPTFILQRENTNLYIKHKYKNKYRRIPNYSSEFLNRNAEYSFHNTYLLHWNVISNCNAVSTCNVAKKRHLRWM